MLSQKLSNCLLIPSWKIDCLSWYNENVHIINFAAFVRATKGMNEVSMRNKRNDINSHKTQKHNSRQKAVASFHVEMAFETKSFFCS